MKFDPVDSDRQVELNEVNLFVLRANPLNADPVPASDLKDGDIWYRGDLNSLRAKINGTIQTLVPVPGNIISGIAGPMDPGVTVGALSVTGDFLTAVASVPSASESAIAITYPSVGSNFVPLLTMESLGNPSFDGDLKAPVIHSITDTSLIINVDGSATLTQSISFRLLLWPVN